MQKKTKEIGTAIDGNQVLTVVAPEASAKKKRETMDAYRVRLPKRDVRRLEQYLGSQGLSLSAGIRMAVNQMLQRVGR
jgi:hypothetical protein